MSYKIIIDSCGEFLDEWKDDERFESVPLTLNVGGETVIDDDTFDQAEFLKKVAACPECPKSACPSPERYMKAYECEADHIYAVTLSSELSGSYNSAVLGKDLFVERVEKYIAEQNTFFVLDDLDTLRKNGRLSRVKSLVASALKIKPVMGSTDEGTICQLDQARGINKALIKMVQHVVEKTENSESKVLAISHCNCKDRAMLLKEALQEKLTTKKIIVLDTAGVSSMYANNGGVIVAV